MGPRVSYPRCHKLYRSRLNSSRFPRMGTPGSAGGVGCRMMPSLLSALDQKYSGVSICKLHSAWVRDLRQGTRHRLAVPSRLVSSPCPGICWFHTPVCAVLSLSPCSRGRGHVFYFVPLPHQQGAFRPRWCFPRGADVVALPKGVRRRPSARYVGPARLDISRHLRHTPAARRIGLGQLLLLCRGQVSAHIFDRTAQFKKDMIRQWVVTLPDR